MSPKSPVEQLLHQYKVCMHKLSAHNRKVLTAFFEIVGKDDILKHKASSESRDGFQKKLEKKIPDYLPILACAATASLKLFHYDQYLTGSVSSIKVDETIWRILFEKLCEQKYMDREFCQISAHNCNKLRDILEVMIAATVPILFEVVPRTAPQSLTPSNLAQLDQYANVREPSHVEPDMEAVQSLVRTPSVIGQNMATLGRPQTSVIGHMKVHIPSTIHGAKKR